MGHRALNVSFVMPIKDGSAASQFHSEALCQCTRRIKAKIAVSGTRSPDPQQSILGYWENAPRVYLNYHRASRHLGGFSTGQASSLITALGLSASDNVLVVGAGFGWASEWLRAFVPGMDVTNIDTSAWIHSVKGQDERGDIEAALDDARDPVFRDTIVGVTGADRDLFMAHLDEGVRATETIIDEDGLSNRSRQQIRNAGVGAFTHIITANVLPWLWDAEAADLADAMRQIEASARIVHYVTPYSDTAGQKDEPAPMLNWKRVGDARPVASKLTNHPNYIESDWRGVLPDDDFILAGANKVFI